MKKKIISWTILIVSGSLIVSLSRDIAHLLKAGDRVKQAEREVTELKQKQAQLEKQKEYYQSEEFVEQQARDKLNYSREGEEVVVLPPNIEELVGRQETPVPPKLPNWQQWWQLFN